MDGGITGNLTFACPFYSKTKKGMLMLTILSHLANFPPLMQVKQKKIFILIVGISLLQSCYTMVNPPQTLPQSVTTIISEPAMASSFGGGWCVWLGSLLGTNSSLHQLSSRVWCFLLQPIQLLRLSSPLLRPGLYFWRGKYKCPRQGVR
jgi:hypothetical protein